jgi:hypothetical protein
MRYIHNNPVEGGITEAPEDYRYSSSRYWLKKGLLDDEPIEVDIKQIEWLKR